MREKSICVLITVIFFGCRDDLVKDAEENEMADPPVSSSVAHTSNVDPPSGSALQYEAELYILSQSQQTSPPASVSSGAGSMDAGGPSNSESFATTTPVKPCSDMTSSSNENAKGQGVKRLRDEADALSPNEVKPLTASTELPRVRRACGCG